MISNDNIDDLLNQALDAQDSISSINFDAVAQHESDALQQVDQAITRLQQMEASTSPQAAHERRVMSALERAHLSGRAGHLFSDRSGLGDDGLLPSDLSPHRDGLPAFAVVLAPDYSPAPGLHGLFVTRKGIVSASLAMPLADNRWTIHQTAPFNSPEHMVTVMAGLMVPAADDSATVDNP